MILKISLIIYFFMVPWGAVQFIAGRGWDWLVLSVSGMIVWAAMVKEASK